MMDKVDKVHYMSFIEIERETLDEEIASAGKAFIAYLRDMAKKAGAKDGDRVEVVVEVRFTRPDEEV